MKTYEIENIIYKAIGDKLYKTFFENNNIKIQVDNNTVHMYCKNLFIYDYFNSSISTNYFEVIEKAIQKQTSLGCRMHY